MKAQISNVVVAGKSGAGKQPRIDVLVSELGLSQLSTGNIFREYLGTYKRLGPVGGPAELWRDGGFAPDDELRESLAPAAGAAGVDLAAAVLGLKAAHFVDQGLFVPDSITNELFSASFRRAGGRGLVLDGFPRTVDQASYLLGLARELGTRLDLVLIVDNDDEAIVARTVGRRICPKASCGKVFHLEHKPPRDGRYCTACGTEVILRSDDSEPKIRKRLQEFRDKAEPAIRALTGAGVATASVPGNLPVFSEEAVRQSVLEALRSAGLA